MTAFSWLHLTDLHWGMNRQASLWPRLRQKFWDDLAQLHRHTGPWDLVLFTGDLTQSGAREEFAGVVCLLDELWEQMSRLGSRPHLLAVPGNHDLLRGQGFDNYVEWWSAEPHRPPVQDGPQPGDFAATVEKGGVALGIVGLNTSFLQLSERGRLTIRPEQFHQTCGGDGVAWASRHHACLLMTHHPPQWLDAAGRVTLESEINDPGQFAVHLCGHLHEALYTSISRGGGPARRLWQGRSLFGLERFGARERRSHGFSVGVLEFEHDHARLTFWPREARRLQDKSWSLVADQSFRLGFCTPRIDPEPIPLLRPFEGLLEREPVELTYLRNLARTAETIQELRRLMRAVTRTEHASGPAARLLMDQIREAMSEDRSLDGFNRED